MILLSSKVTRQVEDCFNW